MLLGDFEYGEQVAEQTLGGDNVGGVKSKGKGPVGWMLRCHLRRWCGCHNSPLFKRVMSSEGTSVCSTAILKGRIVVLSSDLKVVNGGYTSLLTWGRGVMPS